MRLPEVLGVLGALVVGAVLAVFLLSSALGEQPALPTPVSPTIAALPSIAPASTAPSASVTPSSLPGTPGAALAIGQQAPPLEVTLLDGSSMNTTDFAGKPMWINFMATWCPQCQAELPMMTEYEKLLDDSMTVLVVDVGEDHDTVKAFMKSLDFDLPVGVDEDGSVASSWGAYALPVHYLIDDQGIVQQVVYGGAPPDIFIQAITVVVPDFSAVAPTPVASDLLTLPPDTPAPAETASPAQ
jgi:thiol-disulfide isomerase/thioredoxin